MTMRNDFYGIMALSSALSAIILLNSLISKSHGYGLLNPYTNGSFSNELRFNPKFCYGFPSFPRKFSPDSQFFEVRTGYWLYSCLFSSTCNNFDRGLANNFGYGAEWYYDECEFSTGSDNLPDRPFRCKRTTKIFPDWTLQDVPITPTKNIPSADVNQFLNKESPRDAEELCAVCSKTQIPAEGFTYIFYVRCECLPGCFHPRLNAIEDEIFRYPNREDFGCFTGTTYPPPVDKPDTPPNTQCKCYLRQSKWSTEELDCTFPVFNCSMTTGEII